MNFKNLISSCAVFFMCAAAQAANTNSGRMHVQISNLTTSSCNLTDQTLSHGTFDSAPPSSIMSGDSKAFDVMQTIMGPDVMLTYSCNGYTTSFEVQQDKSIFLGQTPKLTVYVTNGLTLQYTSESSSVPWNSPGIIYITIK
jgi:hypothetical protein